jgi:hypothetical protein
LSQSKNESIWIFFKNFKPKLGEPWMSEKKNGAPTNENEKFW